MENLEKLTDEQQAVIVHEAGHAAMAIFLNLTPVEVTLGFDGRGVAKALPEFKGFSLKDNKKRIKVLKAGFLAERKFTKQTKDHGELDRERIKDVLVEDCISHLDQVIESEVVNFINLYFNTKIMELAELISYNYNNGQNTTLTSELESKYKKANG